MKKHHPFKVKFTLMLVVIFTLSLIAFSQRASSNINVPDIKVIVSQNSIKAGVNEEFTINYHFEPQPIPMELISPQTDKEIVLVIDTSGSMKDPIGKNDSTIRMNALKSAANNFIDKFSEIDNVKVGIVTYSTQSKIETTKYSKNGMVSSKEKNNLKAIIKGMTPDGGTNIGDGLRTGSGLFSTNPSTKKYLVFMSDGEPTALTYTGDGGYYYYDWWGDLRYQVVESTNFAGRRTKEYMWGKDNTENKRWNYYYNIYENDYDIKYGVYGGTSEPADKGFALKYAKIMARNVKDMGIKNFVIGFSEGASEKKLMDITNAANGLYYGATDANAINEVYSQIADQIKADFATEDVKINFNLPEGIEYAGSMKNIDVNGTSFAQRIPDIKYKLNKEAKRYEAEPFDISITLKATKSGAYDLSNEGWNISYKGVNSNIINKIFPSVNIDISKYNMTFIMNRNIVENNKKINLYKDFQMEYKITPNPIKPSDSFVSKPKEVVLVLDASKSMLEGFNGEEKTSVLKETAKAVIDRFNGNTNVKVALVSYNSGAIVKDFGKSQYLISSNNKDQIKNAIENLTIGEGSNTGDAIRKALWVLANNNDADKHIVVIGDDKTDYYTHEKDQPNNLYTELNNEALGTKAQYAPSTVPNEYNKILSEEYARIMAGAIVNQNYRISSYFITLGEKGDNNLFSELASKTNGMYIDHRRTNKLDFQNSMLDIADEVRAQFVIKNPKLIETLPEGITSSQGANKMEIVLPSLVYIYNNATKQYESKGITATLDLKGNKIGTYNLVEDAAINYTDIEKINRSLTFHPLQLSIVDEYILKQGLFTNKATTFGTLGENYLLNDSNEVSEIAEDFTAKVGAYVRTSGQPTRVKIIINKDQNSNIQNINMDSIRLFKVTEKNELEEIKDFNFTNDKVLDNYREITVSLPPGDTSKYNHFIINYNFSTTNKGVEGGNINCSAVIEEVNRSNDFILKSVMLPDVF